MTEMPKMMYVSDYEPGIVVADDSYGVGDTKYIRADVLAEIREKAVRANKRLQKGDYVGVYPHLEGIIEMIDELED